MQPLGLLVVDHLVGFDAGAVVEQLHIADRRDTVVVVVVVDLDRLHEHLAVIGDARTGRLRRTRIVGEALRGGGLRRHQFERAGQQHGESHHERGKRGNTHPSPARGYAPGWGQPQLEGGDDRHYPSSWYSKAKKPVRPPTNTGSHAATIGCINSALLRSSVTFDKT